MFYLRDSNQSLSNFSFRPGFSLNCHAVIYMSTVRGQYESNRDFGSQYVAIHSFLLKLLQKDYKSLKNLFRDYKTFKKGKGCTFEKHKKINDM